jgi:CRP/FNR family cyclic AMP-dependent transcriptional regulator
VIPLYPKRFSLAIATDSEPTRAVPDSAGQPIPACSKPACDTQAIDALRKAHISFTMVVYPARTPLFPQGIFTDSVFLVASGLVKLSHTSSDGKEIIVGIRRSGWVLGMAATILNQPQPTAAVAVTRCRLLRIPAREIRLLDAEATFFRYLLELQAQEVHDHLQNLIQMASYPAEYRLASLLSEFASGVDSSQSEAGRNTRIPLKQWEIADLLGVSPEHTCRVLHQLEQKGLVLRKGRALFVPEPERLHSFLDR